MVISSSPGQKNLTPFQGCQISRDNQFILQKRTPAIIIQNLSDFCITSKEKSMKLSVRKVQDFPGKNAISAGKSDSLEM